MMQKVHGSTLRICRLPVVDSTLGLVTNGGQATLARAHPLLQGHIGIVDTNGLYYVIKLREDGLSAFVVAVYELQICTEGGPTQPVRKLWCDFQHLPDDGLVLIQRSSGRILFAQLPPCEDEEGPVFHFGSHDGPVLSLAANRDVLLSGGADGCVRLWGLDTGTLLDCCNYHGAAAVGAVAGAMVTAVAFAGPLMVAAGTNRGGVCLYDISTSRLFAVQRFIAGEGPVGALACRLTPRQTHDVLTASAPRGLDGGGVLVGLVGLPWRSPPDDADTLLAVASPAGWLSVFCAAGGREDGLRAVHCRAVGGQPFLSWSADGNYLALGAGDRLEVLDAATFTTVHHQVFQPHGPLAAAGFLPSTAGGSSLVALQRGATLTGGIRLRLFAVPAGGEPLLLQLTLPLPKREHMRHQPTASPSQDQDYLSCWLQRESPSTEAALSHADVLKPVLADLTFSSPDTAANPAALLAGGAAGQQSGSSPVAGGAAGQQSGSSLRNVTWGWQAFVTTPASESGSLLAGALCGGRIGGADVGQSPSSRPWAALPPVASDSTTLSPRLHTCRSRSPAASPRHLDSTLLGAGLREAARGSAAISSEGKEAVVAHTWQAYRPATQPAPRSWITGLPPRPDFLALSVVTESSVNERMDSATAGGTLRTVTDIAIKSSDLLQSGGAAGIKSGVSELELPHWGTFLPAVGHTATAGTEPVDAASVAEGDVRHATDSRMLKEGSANVVARDVKCQRSSRPASGLHKLPAANIGPRDGDPSSLLQQEEFREHVAIGDDEWFQAGHNGLVQRGWGFQAGSGSGEEEARGPGLAAADQAGPVSWRAGDLDMAPGEFRTHSSGAADHTTAAATALDDPLAASFRFCLPQHHQQPQRARQQYAQRKEAGDTREDTLPTSETPGLYQRHVTTTNAATTAPTAGAEVYRSSSAVDLALCGEGGSNSPGHGLDSDSSPHEIVDWAQGTSDTDPLGRAAYFGDALIMALQDNSEMDAEPSRSPVEQSGGGRAGATLVGQGLKKVGYGHALEQVDVEEVAPQALDLWQSQRGMWLRVEGSREASQPCSAAGTSTAVASRNSWLGSSSAPGHGEAEVSQWCREVDGAEEDAESPMPRGSSRLPLPQPEWSQLRGLSVQWSPGGKGPAGEPEDQLEEVSPLQGASRSGAIPGDSQADELTADSAFVEQGESGQWSGRVNANLLDNAATVVHQHRDQHRHEARMRGLKRNKGAQKPQVPSHDLVELPMPLTSVACAAAAAVTGHGPCQQTQLRPQVDASAVAASPVLEATDVLPAQRPALSAFRGFKQSHAKLLQQLKRTQVHRAKAIADTALVAGVAEPVRQLNARYGADDGEDNTTPSSSAPVTGGRSNPPSMPQSPCVRLGSPYKFATADAGRSGTAAPESRPTHAAQHQQQQKQAEHAPGPISCLADMDSAQGAGATASGSRRTLQHLRQLRQQQQQLRLRSSRILSAVSTSLGPASAATAQGTATAPAVAAIRSIGTVSSSRGVGGAEIDCLRGVPLSSETTTSAWASSAADWSCPMQAGGSQQPPQLQNGSPSGVTLHEGYNAGTRQDVDVDVGKALGVGRPSLHVPQLGSTGALLLKMQTLARAVSKQPTKAEVATGSRPASWGHGRGRGARGVGSGVLPLEGDCGGGAEEAVWEEAARRAATSAANVPPDAQLYRDLPALDEPDKLQHPVRVVKQLHPGWVASRQTRPELGTLWRTADLVHEVCNTRGVALYTPPSAAEVAAATLSLQWLF